MTYGNSKNEKEKMSVTGNEATLYYKVYGGRQKFKSDLYPQLMQSIDDYAALIRLSAQLNGEIWPTDTNVGRYIVSSKDMDTNVPKLKLRLLQRVNHIDGDTNKGLY